MTVTIIYSGRQSADPQALAHAGTYARHLAP